MERQIVVLGVNHRTAPVEVREKLAFQKEEVPAALLHLLERPSVREAAILSTCNRVEVIACVGAGADATDQIIEFLAFERGVCAEDFRGFVYSLVGKEAIRHLFRVSSSLDSMVVGEPQILGQIKDHYGLANQAKATGTVLHKLFHKAFSVAKQVRTETGIAGKAVSVSSAAVDLARKIFEKLDDKTAMLVGAGEMSELAARHLIGHGIGSLIVTNRTFDRAVEMARDFHGTAVPFEEMQRYLRLADVVIGSAGGADYLITRDQVQKILRERKQRPMFLIDMGVPRNFDPEINELDNVYLYDIDDLGSVVEENRDEREREALRAEAIIQREVDEFWQWFSGLEVVPTIVALRQKVEEIRQREVEKVLNSSKGNNVPREVLDGVTSAIVNKILHEPITKLKQGGDPQTEALYLEAARKLFGIGEKEREDGSAG